ncbi:methyltransferase domain-containing protein [Paenibacillus alvei]|uniref:Methyltransferase domain-containing protein n=1 Tax=Paenibacillus alvei TaxID=44250 RepID=A0ABT4H4S2_PAEAL|nr:class I SAM-dependent methyltransferase [Paenibacillus alvei]EJW19311.1 methylase involved in ubiquinone/menaquinone biosynthesis [Paenibacillus alvei DSM 29]MCY7483693.1 methyltransferase domain-containing protein [Paenibacillus alvei]MCY9543223.1 methyltransferase domain-containing protein [Paenibacillus alvei]MCY9704818.1 methyltransferase domain-containing protein [Paenibacillus alvei]MCY9735903.1 methyltransferase domain-containing protein [Paenibacillus alvei]
MKAFDYKQFYDRVGKQNGWDFSQVKSITEGLNWELFTEVRGLCTKSDMLLDIGTGGGESVLPIADNVLQLIGIDASASMIRTARANLEAAQKPNVRFIQMNAELLKFPDRHFDIITCRHSEFSAAEVARVLTDDGVFLTQQISEGNKLNLKQAFGRGQAYGVESGTLLRQYIAELREAGFTHIQSVLVQLTQYYQTSDDLLFILTHTPTIPDFGQYEHDMRSFNQFVADNMTNKGIRTNEERFAILARKH